MIPITSWWTTYLAPSLRTQVKRSHSFLFVSAWYSGFSSNTSRISGGKASNAIDSLTIIFKRFPIESRWTTKRSNRNTFIPPLGGMWTRALPETINCLRASNVGTRIAFDSTVCVALRSIRARASSALPR